MKARAGSMLLAAAAGAILAVQVRVNGALGEVFHSGALAAAVSFAVGVTLSGIAVLASGKARRGLARVPALLRSGRIRWWELLGGLSGALFICAQSITGALLGAALFGVGVIGGQVFSGLIVDRAGLGPAGVIPVTAVRAAAAFLGLAAGAIAATGAADLERTLWLMLLPLAAGASVAWQHAANATVAVASDDPLGVVFLNFVVGVVILVPIAVAVVVGGEWTTTLPQNPLLYAGGLLGTGYVVLANILVARVGVLVFGLASISGQLLTSVIVDVALPAAVAVSPALLWGVLIALTAVVLSAVPATQRARGGAGDSGASSRCR